jgi:hypothetical protein
MNPRLQKILDETRHPVARAWVEWLFVEQHENVMERLRRAAENKLCEERLQVHESVFGHDAWDVDDIPFVEWEALDEIGQEVLNRYISKSQDQLRRGKFGSGNLRSQVKRRQNRLTGIRRANDRINRPEPGRDVEEGLGTAAFNIAKKVATDSVAHGLGMSGSTVDQITRDLLSKNHSASPKPAPQKPQKPQRTKPAATHQPAATTHSSSEWQPIEIHHVFNGTPTEHEHLHQLQRITHAINREQ